MMQFVLLLLFLIVNTNNGFVYWNVEEWSKCEVHESCRNPGVRTRLVDCRNALRRIIPDKHCVGDSSRKPKQRSNCVPNKCLPKLTASLRLRRTSWSNCTAISLKEWTTVNKYIRARNEVKKCSDNSNLIVFVKYRNVTCYLLYRNETMELSAKLCLDVYNVASTEWKLCFHSCINNCSLSKWSDWTRCQHCRLSNIKYKRKQYTSLPNVYGYKNICPSVLKIKAKRIKLHKQLQQFRLSNWDNGKVIRGKKQQQRFPSFTVKKRNITCIDNQGKLCDEEGLSIHSMKIVVTDKPCQLSDWSMWSPCNKNNSYAVNATGTQFRKKRIEILPIGNGRTCDTQITHKECRMYEVKNYNWFLGDWSSCEKSKNLFFNCSVSYNTRHAFCYQLDDVTKTPVDDYKCRHVRKPVTEKICKLICQDECVYNEWTSWSFCRKNKTQRTKDLISYDVTCPRIIQKKFCDMYTWKRVNPSSCRIKNISASCGEGVTLYELNCIDPNENKIEDRFCGATKRPQTSENCRIPCAGDCVVSEWKDWGSCIFNYRRRVRYILSPGLSTVMTCPHLTETESCVTEDNFWSVSQWGQCEYTQTNTTTTTSKCISGYRNRQVFCVKRTINNIVDMSQCDLLVKPKTEKLCTICKKDCVLSPWSHWQPSCRAVCSSLYTGSQPNAQRKRFIITHGDKYGNKFPDNLIETEMCPPCADYYWVVKGWDICLHSTVPGRNFMTPMGMQNGVQIRHVYCSDGFDIVHDGMCLDLNQPKPQQHRECEINWLVTCTVEPWSDWSACTEKCGRGTQERKRQFSSASCKTKTNNEFNFLQTKACNTQPCREYLLYYGEWGACHPYVTVEDCSTRKTIFGVQWRNVSCRDANRSLVPNVYCEEDTGKKLMSQKHCAVPCTTDCHLADWSTFSECSATCGTGTSIRSRRILAQPWNSGRACPSSIRNFVTEAIPCKIKECFDSVWKTEEWGQCVLNTNSTCGRGQQSRLVKCVDSVSGTESTNCTQNQPIRKKNCRIYCEDDCVVSDWSVWSTCSKSCLTCSSTRKRDILRQGTSKGKSCPSLVQHHDHIECKNFSWKINKWSDCILDSDVTCGVGIRKRILDCVNNDGEIIDPAHCNLVPYVSTHEVCTVPCASRCEVSAWSEWSECDQKCGTSKYSTRRRYILNEITSKMNVCDKTVLKESLLCPILPCYTLLVDDWPACQPLYNNTCGAGEQVRNAVCRRGDGNEVDLEYCFSYVTGATKMTRQCVIPCWNDCITTPWSTWSECFGVCDHSNKLMLSHGFTVRSRSILQNSSENGIACPHEFEQQKVCPSPKCFTQEKINNQCMRSDGMELSYGCKFYELQKKHLCKCPVQNSKCIKKRYCRCNIGYDAMTNGSNHLKKCVLHAINAKLSSEDESDTDVTVIIWVAVAICVAYCILLFGLIVLYKRLRKKASLKRQVCTNNNSYYESVTTDGFIEIHGILERSQNNYKPRQLLTSLTEGADSCTSGVSSIDCLYSQWQLEEEKRLLREVELDETLQLDTKL